MPGRVSFVCCASARIARLIQEVGLRKLRYWFLIGVSRPTLILDVVTRTSHL